VAGLDEACARIGVMQVEEDGKVVGAGDRDGGIMACSALGLEGREISFVWDLPVVSGDLGGCESNPKWFLRDLVEDVDERRNKSSGSMGWASRSELPSKSESRGTNDFLRRGTV
jgi:hypothetical protein